MELLPPEDTQVEQGNEPAPMDEQMPQRRP
jgi:hypothetical protein